MKKTQEELENAINSSPLFSIDHVNNGELFAKEEERLLADLVKLMSSRRDFDKIGFEIICTAKSCVNCVKSKSYKPEKGKFLNFFNVSLQQNIRWDKGKQEIADIRKGIKISKKMDLVIRNLSRYAKMHNVKDADSDEFAVKASNALAVPIEEVREAIAINKYINVDSGNRAISGDGDSRSELFDFVEDKSSTTEEKIEETEDLIHKIRQDIKSIDAKFKKEHEGRQPLLAKLLTVDLLTDLKELRILDDVAIVDRVFSGISFINHEIYANYVGNGVILTYREIAKIHDKFESSVNRTRSRFKEKGFDEHLEK
ncbi:MAG: hypothetical protein FWB78_00265 [Treponema sp.]|nr:hypothetical protein [Treponema sp.]